MEQKKKALGRGLEELFSTEVLDFDTFESNVMEEAKEEESGFVKVIRVILTVLEVIASIALVVVVLLQSGKEAGLSSTLSGNADSYLSKTGKGGLDKMLAKSTKWLALVWIVLTLVLSLL